VSTEAFGAGRSGLFEHGALAAFAVSVPALVTLEWWIPGGIAFVVSLGLTWATNDAVFRRRMLVLLGCVGILALAPINTSTADIKFVTLGLPFLAVVLLPWLILRATDPGVVTFKFWPKRFSRLEFAYVLLSIPLAWGGLRLYFGLSPEVPWNWSLPPTPDDGALLRLFAGINAVGIWDELFFVNTCFAILRSSFSFWTANLAQTVVYTSVLVDMAFRGVGPAFVALLAITQGIMFERSKVLVYVLVVHLIVDYFLFQEIVTAQYPGFRAWWHP
jgi:membrane protease YdiL (CAAX protease family)